MNVLVLEDPAAEVAERLARAAEAGAHIALTGGSTPAKAYERAASLDADWSGATQRSSPNHSSTSRQCSGWRASSS